MNFRMAKGDEYNLDGKKVLLFISVQIYKTEENPNGVDLPWSKIDLKKITETFEERVT